MWSSDSEPDHAAGAAAITTASSSTCSSSPSTPPLPSPTQPPPRRHKNIAGVGVAATGREAEAEDVWHGDQWEAAWPRRAKPVVVAAEETETDSTGPGSSPRGGDGMGRARSLTDDDLAELKGCADLGFGFSYDEIPELRGTLPALELCYSMSQRFVDQPQPPQEQETAATPTSTTTTSPPVANWKISSPGT
ncbi:hypothetical protein CFC21_107147 [Triticum aestivum]|uniref:Uncharacterized protein n=2 Tax=Triticum aestivum TaxID=4565 RepID=A0A3B6TCZ5_WHEAT|nr:hypothetical protein CFC21_107147 [Triticum aestivum]